MPYIFEFDPVHRVILCTYTGRVTDSELQTYYRDAALNVQHTDPLAAILDFTGVTTFAASTSTVRQLAISDPALPDPARPRFIVAPSDHVYAMSRMYQLVGETTRPRLHVVRTLKEALSAIGVKESRFEKISW